MNAKLVIISFLIVFLRAPSLLAKGDNVGNGGGAWACIKNEKIKKIELVDIFEGENVYHHQYFREPNVQLLLEKIKREVFEINKGFTAHLTHEFDLLAQKIRFTDHILSYTEDIKPIIIPQKKWCSKEAKLALLQVANYSKDDQLLLINRQAYSALSSFQKGALLIHEAVYKIRRDLFKDSDSITARKIVAALLANDDKPERKHYLKQILAHEYYTSDMNVNELRRLPSYQHFKEIFTRIRSALPLNAYRFGSMQIDCDLIINEITVTNDGYQSYFHRIFRQTFNFSKAPINTPSKTKRSIQTNIKGIELHFNKSYLHRELQDTKTYIMRYKDKYLIEFYKPTYNQALYPSILGEYLRLKALALCNI